MNARRDASRQTGLALQIIILLGVVSALGDITYEGARSISGPYLALLGAGASVVGLVSGLGEFVGYALRLLAGYVADRTKAYWWVAFVGYGLLISIPLLALANRWEIAALFLILERVGKAIRAPARDAILSHATQRTGRGWGFALHEALDQIGAIIGPFIFTVVFLLKGSYRSGFTVLWVPAILTLVALSIARIRVPSPEKLETPDLEKPQAMQSEPGFSRVFWLYALFTFLSVAGFANFQIISYHLAIKSIVPAAQIPVLYAVAMGVDALAALAIGKVYDRAGMTSLLIIPFVTIPIPFLAFSSSYRLVWGAMVLWGIAMAIHETIMRAAVADMTPSARRGTAYGIFNTVYGASWFVGSALMGLLYDLSSTYFILFVLAAEIVSLPIFLLMRRANSREVLGKVGIG